MPRCHVRAAPCLQPCPVPLRPTVSVALLPILVHVRAPQLVNFVHMQQGESSGGLSDGDAEDVAKDVETSQRAEQAGEGGAAHGGQQGRRTQQGGSIFCLM